MVLDTRIALHHLFAEEGSVCAIVNTSCFTQINTSGIIETRIQGINKCVTWLKQIDASLGTFFDIFDTKWFVS